MNIGIVCYPTFGGSGVIATELGKALAEKGHQVHFITYQQPVKLDAFSDNIHFHEVTVKEYPLFHYPPYELVLSSKLVDVAKFEKLDLLHVHYAIPHASAAYMASKILSDQGMDLPFITTLHGTDITLVGKDPSFEPVITFAINHSTAVTAVSESLREDTYKHFGVSRDIRVIHNFICKTDYQKPPQKNLIKMFAPGGEKLVTHVSNFRKVKRVEDVVKVFDKIRHEVDARLLLVGDGPERYRIESLCRELGTCDKIKFLGKLKNTEEVLKISDLFLLTSESESFGLAALEAMAAGTPVISTNTGGLPEVNKHNYSGFLSDVGNIEEMAANSLLLLKDEEKLSAFKKNARQQAAEFDIARILPVYEELYQQVTSKENA